MRSPLSPRRQQEKMAFRKGTVHLKPRCIPSLQKNSPKKLAQDYLEHYGIEPKGILRQILEANWKPALNYLAYAVQRYPEHPGIRKKITYLAGAMRGGRSLIEEEKNTEGAYSAALFEFKALYAITHIMGYEFVNCDVKVGGVSRHSKKDCDLTIKRNGKISNVRVDAKRWSGDIRSRRIVGGIRRYDPVPKIGQCSARWKIGEWLKKRVQEVSREKRVQILVVHLPGLEDKLSIHGLKRYCDEILPGVLMWDGNEPVWC